MCRSLFNNESENNRNMNKFFSNTKKTLLAALAFGLFAPSCSQFLDIVPDNVFQYEDFFVSQKQAMNALAGIYNGTPYDQAGQPWMLGDEWVFVNPQINASRTTYLSASIMRGNQSATNTLLSFWTGHNTFCNLYGTIRDCDMFILNVDRIPDMTADMKAFWKGQAIFLKAYYMFMLVQAYGPVVIPKIVDPSELNSDLFLYRSKVEDCFDYILNLLDEAIPYLKGKAGIDELGQADKVTALAIKARVLLYRASPFYNGNSEYYGNFLDHNGEHFFAQTEDREKWKAAAEAAQTALDACEEHGFRLYHFSGRPYDYDVLDFVRNPERMRTFYDLCFRITERWNEEIIWGCTRLTNENMAAFACIRKPAGYGGPGQTNDGNGAGGASYQVMERYFTKNGLPLEEDRTVNRNELHNIVNVPDETTPEYQGYEGYMQPGVSTVKMYLDREPRFYADLGITGGYYRAFQVRIRTVMFQNTDGGFFQNVHGQMFNPSGIAVQKDVHPESYGATFATQIKPPYPVIRVADLYLMKAEALNEYYGPSQEVYDAVNAVRRRAGIPEVEESYSNPDWTTDAALNKHLTREGMREIILRERASEFAFEFAHRFSDMQRWKRSISEFSRPLYGWNYLGTNAAAFFNRTIVQGRNWSITDCLWPIDNREMERNAKLIQNPGW